MLNIVTPPAVEPLSLSDAKLNLKVDYTEDDSLISTLITAARVRCETISRRTFITTVYDHIIDGFPYAGGYLNRNIRYNPTLLNWLPSNAGVIELPRPPLQSVTYITYLDQTGTLQTLDPSVYRVLKGSESVGKVTTQINKIFPITSPQIGSVTIRLVCGYGDTSASVPKPCIQAMNQLIAHWYNHREGVSDIKYEQVPETVYALLDSLWWGSYA